MEKIKPTPPRLRIYLEGVGWLCNKKINIFGFGCKKRLDHKGECKHRLTFWELTKRQFGF